MLLLTDFGLQGKNDKMFIEDDNQIPMQTCNFEEINQFSGFSVQIIITRKFFILDHFHVLQALLYLWLYMYECDVLLHHFDFSKYNQ